MSRKGKNDSYLAARRHARGEHDEQEGEEDSSSSDEEEVATMTRASSVTSAPRQHDFARSISAVPRVSTRPRASSVLSDDSLSVSDTKSLETKATEALQPDNTSYRSSPSPSTKAPESPQRQRKYPSSDAQSTTSVSAMKPQSALAQLLSDEASTRAEQAQHLVADDVIMLLYRLIIFHRQE
jgi:hypothetical protein